jgi:hypothetical protein
MKVTRKLGVFDEYDHILASPVVGDHPIQALWCFLWSNGWCEGGNHLSPRALIVLIHHDPQ